MNRIGIPESERQELLAYLKKTYKYDDGHIVNQKTGKRRRECKINRGYLEIIIRFKGNLYHISCHRFVWALCNDRLPTLTIDHINGDQLDNRIENLREVSQSDNLLNWLLPWKPNKDTGVAGVWENKGGFRSIIRGAKHYFHNPYEAFFWGVQCGKRYRA